MNEICPILLVEDSRDDVELITSALEHLRNRIDVASDGEQALDYLYRRGAHEGRRSGNPGLVLLDLKLPKVSGLEVLAEMRNDKNLKHIPVVILTSSREDQDLLHGYQRGANAYVVKPVKFADFIDAVKEIGLFWAVLNEVPPPAGRIT
jgi:CheY-like chemotaxis protein